MNDAAIQEGSRAGLASCPFCGGPGSLYPDAGAATCQTCGISVYGRSDDLVADAVHRWNRRAPARYPSEYGGPVTGVVHHLKTQDPHYGQVASGAKRFELRVDDRPYAVGDRLRLQQWSPERFYSGEHIDVLVTHVLRGLVCGSAALAEGWVAMSIIPAWPNPGREPGVAG